MMSDEEWRKIPGIDGYYASSFGRIKGPTFRVRRLKLSKAGYHQFGIADGYGSSKNVSVARSVCLAFHGLCPDGHECDHINGIRNDDRPENLRWVTKSENLARRRVARGSDHYLSKLTEGDVIAIRSSEFSHLNNPQLAREICVARETVRDIRNRKEWKHVD